MFTITNTLKIYSFLADYIMAELATTQQVDTITTKINAPTSGNLLSFMSKCK